ncbi:MAG TPA: hypothetical protein VER14_03855, partial [Phototrophicaceae bacterium]|nr:hypothetical protein [Phototrophicaceae bacterium]
AGVSASGDDPPTLEENGTCTATCLNGATVTCKGKDCTAIDNQGCTGGTTQAPEVRSCPST